jgi:Zn/Cd-binding protein ZinT
MDHGMSTNRHDRFMKDYANKATKVVNEMVLQLENLLYEDEESTIQDQNLQDECRQWNSLFPHLRSIQLT